MIGFLKNKRVLITGSYRGLGLGIAKVFAARGAHIVLHNRNETEESGVTERMIKNCGAGSVQSVFCDLGNHDSIKSTFAKIEPVDVLCNNAGIQIVSGVENFSLENWKKIIDVNLTSNFCTTQAVLPSMIKKGFGRIINISSVHGLVASKNKSAYVASKHGLIGFTKAVALECANAGTSDSGGVTVNAICPGWVETKILENQIMQKAIDSGVSRPEALKSLISEKQPTMRLSTPEDVGELAAYLAGKSAHNVTGAVFTMDGGWTCQ